MYICIYIILLRYSFFIYILTTFFPLCFKISRFKELLALLKSKQILIDILIHQSILRGLRDTLGRRMVQVLFCVPVGNK